MIGTFANVSTIIIGSLAGGLLKRGLGEKYQDVLYTAMGLAAVGIGVNAIVNNMPKSEYPVLFIISLAVGSLIGTFLDLDTRFNKLVNGKAKTNLGQGLSTAIMMFCIGTLSILGPIESALNHNHTYLFTNATLDLITSFVLASTYGVGIAFAAVVLFLWQGSIFMLAEYASPFLTPIVMCEISVIGGFLIFASILKIKEIKTLNLLPSLFLPVIWFLII